MNSENREGVTNSSVFFFLGVTANLKDSKIVYFTGK